MLFNFKDCNIEAAAVTYLFFLCNFKGHFHLNLKLPICTKNVCNSKANLHFGAQPEKKLKFWILKCDLDYLINLLNRCS